MTLTNSDLKRRILDLLEEDREFRVSVGGLIGFKEILEKLEAHDRKFNEILERLDRHDERFEEHDRKFEEILGRLEEHDRKFEEILGRLEEHDRKFEEILVRLDRHEERLEEHSRRLDEHSKRIEELSTEIKALRVDFNEGMRAFQLRLDALGARWGILAEDAFREGIKGMVERYFGGKVRKWVYEDEEGLVFGHPASIEVDVLVRDKEHVLVEVKSSISRGDIATLIRKGMLYERVKGMKPSLAIVSPFVEVRALEDAEALGIQVFTKLSR